MASSTSCDMALTLTNIPTIMRADKWPRGPAGAVG
jgi:hypothetical protein